MYHVIAKQFMYNVDRHDTRRSAHRYTMSLRSNSCIMSIDMIRAGVRIDVPCHCGAIHGIIPTDMIHAKVVHRYTLQ